MPGAALIGELAPPPRLDAPVRGRPATSFAASSSDPGSAVVEEVVGLGPRIVSAFLLTQVVGAAAASTTRRGLLSSAAGGFPPCRLCRYSSQPPPPLLPARDPPEQGPLQTPVGSSRRSANLCRQHLRAERRWFARRSRAMRDGETTLDPDLEWGEGMSGQVDGPIWTRPAGLGRRALASRSLVFSLSELLFLERLSELFAALLPTLVSFAVNGPRILASWLGWIVGTDGRARREMRRAQAKLCGPCVHAFRPLLDDLVIKWACNCWPINVSGCGLVGCPTSPFVWLFFTEPEHWNPDWKDCAAVRCR